MCTALWPRGYGAVYFTGNDDDMPDRFKNISKEITHDTVPMDAVRDYSIGVTDRPNYSTWDAKHDEFLRSKKTSEIFYDPFTKEVVKQVIPLKIVSPEADIILAGRAALAAVLNAGIVLSKEAYKLGPARIGPVAARKMKRAGSMLNKKLIIDKVKDKIEEDVEKAVLGKTKQDLISEQYHKMVDRLGMSDDIPEVASGMFREKAINTNSDLFEEYMDLAEYMRNPEVRKHISDIDKRFGTHYLDDMDDIVDRAKFSTGLVDDLKGNYGQSFYNVMNPYDIRDTKVLIQKGSPSSVFGHEWRHVADGMNNSIFPTSELGAFNKRLKDLIVDNADKSNIDYEAIMTGMIKDGYDFDATMNMAKYMAKPTELSSHIYNAIAIDKAMNKTKGIHKFTKESFEKLLNASGDDAVKRLKLLYEYGVKNKQDFIDKINRSMFTAAGIGYTVNNKTDKNE